VLVDDHPTALVELDASVDEHERLGVADASGDEQHLVVFAGPAAQLHLHTPVDAGDARLSAARYRAHPHPDERLLEDAGQPVVQQRRDAVGGIDQGDVDPSTVKIDAYSAPTAPAPITARLEGIRSRSRIESESCPSGSSNGLFTVDRDGAVTQQPRASTDAFDALTLEVGRDRGGHRLLNLGGPVSEPLERELRRDL
jgi:hypothetical protein